MFSNGRWTIFALLSVLLWNLSARVAVALDACTAADVVAQDPGCSDGLTRCTVTKVFGVSDGCELDFGSRPVTLAGTLDSHGAAVILRAASFTISATGLIDGRGNEATSRTGGTIRMETTGAVTVERTGSRTGRIDVSGIVEAGTIEIAAGGPVIIAGRLLARHLSSLGTGGAIMIRSPGDVTSLAGSLISASGGSDSGGGGLVTVMAGGTIALGEEIDVSGSDGGTVTLSADADIVLNAIRAIGNGDAGAGGTIDVDAGASVRVGDRILIQGTGSRTGSGGGEGGLAFVQAQFGDVVVASDVVAEGAAPDGGGGEIVLTARGTITIQSGATLSVRSNGGQCCGGFIGLAANAGITSAGKLDASGGARGGEIGLDAQSDVALDGAVDAAGRNVGSVGGMVRIQAGAGSPGSLAINTAIDVRGGKCGPQLGCGAGGSVDLSGCSVVVATSGSIQAGAAEGGEIMLTGREQLTIQGALDATATVAAGTDGRTLLQYPSRTLPVLLSGVVTPPPQLLAQRTCAAADEADCLVPCPACGNGTVEFPETCDDTVGPPRSCDGCSAFCQIEDCNDGRACTLDLCDPLLGCRQLLVPPPCTEPPTPTPTATSSLGPTSPATPTVPLSITPTRSFTDTPTATWTSTPAPSRTHPPTASPSPTRTVTRTPPPSATPTPATTPTIPSPTPTAGVRGDGNCDGRVTAADLPALLASIGPLSAGLCPLVDVNGDHVVDEADIAETLAAQFNGASKHGRRGGQSPSSARTACQPHS